MESQVHQLTVNFLPLLWQGYMNSTTVAQSNFPARSSLKGACEHAALWSDWLASHWLDWAELHSRNSTGGRPHIWYLEMLKRHNPSCSFDSSITETYECVVLDFYYRYSEPTHSHTSTLAHMPVLGLPNPSRFLSLPHPALVRILKWLSGFLFSISWWANSLLKYIGSC